MRSLVDRFPPAWRPWLAAAITVLAVLAGGGTVALVTNGGDGKPDRTVTVPLPIHAAPFDGADADRKPDDGVIAAPLAGEAFERAADRVEEGADRKDPAAGAASVQGALQTNKRATKALPLGGAFQSVPGCRTRLLPGDSSSRNGVRPIWLQWHYAVIPNRPGWGDLDLLYNIFADTKRDASSTFGLDAEGHCYYMVPIERKPWTAVATNPFIISVEVIDMGNEATYCSGPCLEQARRIARWVRDQTGIPIRRGTVNPSNRCTPGSSGQVTHGDHGICAGGHVDIGPKFSMDAFARLLAAPAFVLTDAERNVVAGARHPKGTGHSHRYWCRRVSRSLHRVSHGSRHRRPARRAILRRVRGHGCAR